MQFRKKPVVIDAIQLTADNLKECCQFVGRSNTSSADPQAGTLSIYTLEGSMRADVGDWIIKGVKGEFYPCKPDIFAATYEVVDDPLPAPPEVPHGRPQEVE